MIVYRVKVRKNEFDVWQEFTGDFYEKYGYNIEKVEEHIKDNFNTKQFECYEFGIFIRVDISKNNYRFDFIKNIDIIRDNKNLTSD